MFANECIVITGGSSGLGKLLAQHFLAEGARVALLARDPAKLEVACRELGAGDAERTARLMSVACDVSNETAVGPAFARIAERLGPPSWLVNSAGVLKEGTVEQLSVQDFRTLMDINFFGALHCVKAVLPYLRQAGRGRIVNIGSMAGLVSVFGYGPYCASKHALTGFTGVLRMELAPANIRVHMVCPPEFDSPMVDELNRYRSDENRAVVQTIAPMQIEDVAREILAGLRKNHYEIIPGSSARAARLGERLFPSLGRLVSDRRVARAARARAARGDKRQLT